MIGSAEMPSITTLALRDLVSPGFDQEVSPTSARPASGIYFYKSMMTRAYYSVWRDVNHAPVEDGARLHPKIQANVATEFTARSASIRGDADGVHVGNDTSSVYRPLRMWRLSADSRQSIRFKQRMINSISDLGYRHGAQSLA